MPVDFRCDRGDYARVLISLIAREATGASSARHSLRPLLSRAEKNSRKPRAPRAVGSRSRTRRHCEERLVLRSSTKAEATKQSTLQFRGNMDCFAQPVIGRAFARPVGSQ